MGGIALKIGTVQRPIGIRVGSVARPIVLKVQAVNKVVDAGSGIVEDKYYTQSFSDSIDVVVQHNLNKKPAVTIIDSAGDEVEADIKYPTVNQLTLHFSAAFSGIVTCN